ncbi:MAG: fructoselysine 6-kinase [Bauldia sp.]|nr:fructoselysine 6-kinase [Bauldia sp.]
MGGTLATVGDNCIDRYLALKRSTVGGNAVNVAVHLAAAGLAVGYYGAVGADEEGRRTIAALRENGVDTGRVRIGPGATTAYTDIAVDADGERVIAFEDFGACAGYRPTPAEVEELRARRHVHIGWLDDDGALKDALAASGTSVSQDLSVSQAPDHRRSAGLAIAFISAGPSLAEGRRLLAEALSGGARTAVVTCGALGSLAGDDAGTAETGILPVDVVDTLGAGDTFIAGFIAASIAGAPLQACLEAGRDAAAATCLHLGGFPQMPAPLA